MASMKEWAQLGAARRVAELRTELADIERMFPALRSRRRVQDGGAGGTLLPDARGSMGEGRKRRKRPPMSASQKAEVSRRMKAYWAKRRKSAA
jgi:hypothetical protein